MNGFAPRTTARAASTALALLLAAAACGADTGVDPTLSGADDPSATLFVAERAPASGRDALFEGRVVRDQNGCLRQSHADPRMTSQHTFIWPVGWRLESREGHLVVKDAGGQDVGRVGAHVRLGGGEISALHFADISDADARLLEARCPGRYWLVAGNAN